MSLLIIVLALIVLPAVLAAVFAHGLGARFPAMARRKRVALAALGAGLVPVTPGLIAVWRAYHLTTLVPLGAVFMLGLIVAAVVGVPVALRATRRSASQPLDVVTFE
ncbi:hypothetical protein OLX02_08310 [Novosphingobium sp. KCTC 2891]|uniref:hypothetical protein n=1 Tax=Novosphingobium sp. KCTC 2891 TaxID=2989730 RepID=UPI0022219BAB|nr:hypothetical protein [Novosphingobium sp. KCTC 2891]MCW1382825.1 hypothetical protein [Novosphingobium sp. KCTC 2891]